PRYLPGASAIIYTTSGGLMAARFDARALRVVSPSVPAEEHVQATAAGVAQLSISRTGTMLAIVGGGGTELTLVDRNGAARPIIDDKRTFRNPRRSPDGRHIAVTIGQMGHSAIWLYDISSRTLGQLTTDSKDDRAEWSRDGKRLYYVSSSADGLHNAVLARPWDGTGKVDTIVVPEIPVLEVIPLADGRHLLLRQGYGGSATSEITLFTMDSVGSSRASPRLLQSGIQPRVSPDGRWLAFRGGGGAGSHI